MPEQKPYAFIANTGNKFTIYGETVEQALMQHLLTCTRILGRQISLREAQDPDIIIMIRSEDFVPYFDSFEAAASTAWETVSAAGYHLRARRLTLSDRGKPVFVTLTV